VAGRGKRGRDPAVLEVIDRLEVGPVRIEPKRITAPYRVISGRRRGDINLMYKFEEPLLDPESEADLNLASMIAAQVALNYGLFCRRMVFHGLYDEADRDFIRAMAENTAREIYVIKFLKPNPFLTGPAAKLPARRRKRYLRAAVEFRGPRPRRASCAGWSPAPQAPAVLSSGGKDSLLSHGLLDELGLDPHPIFINESGRHWYTALNAYRHFKKHVPRTARVWINSDRVFAWMLRRLPFIRRDFSRIRSDEYPVRLWTVAVFLFGALPLMRKRGLGRLVIGDEFDTSARAAYRGITHYGGLYDQSRYFDNALTRYFRRKGWGVTQLSLLRPLSEMLIEKVLVQRYPDLQRHQVSCHAAHESRGRIRPCGRCEKCRRIVGMLLALGADPGRCGYTAGQVRRCLADLAESGVHQESAGADQLFFLLARKGLLPGGRGAPSGRGHPEIMKLRFDREHAPLHEIPADLREPLLKIFLGHGRGAVRRSGGRWRAFDPLAGRGGKKGGKKR
jgi:hypothetical protein